MHLLPEKGKISFALVPAIGGASGSRAKERGALRLLNYAICEISGKQYRIIPGKTLEVSFQKEAGDIEAAVLLLSEDGKLNLGKPYLKDKLTLKRVEDTKGQKIRVAKFHAKANYRRVTGYRSKLTRVVLPVKKS